MFYFNVPSRPVSDEVVSFIVYIDSLWYCTIEYF